MTKESMDLVEFLRKRGGEPDGDFLREAMGVLVRYLMEADVTEKTGASYGERTPERVTQRNGYRARP